MTDGWQERNWRAFYETAWSERANYISDLIDSGESSITRCINLLRVREKYYRMKSDLDGSGASWRKVKSEEEIDPIDKRNIFTQKPFMGKYILLPYYTRPSHMEFVLDYWNHKGPFDAVVELGSGFGLRIFELFYAGIPASIPLFGGELTDSGVSISRKLAALDPRINATFFSFDHLSPDLHPVKEKKFDNLLMFTCHSLEQVHKIPRAFFRELANCAPNVTVIHMEPFGFQISAETKTALDHKKFIEDRKWNVNFSEAVKQAVADGTCSVETAIMDAFLPTDDINSTSLLVWKNIPSNS
ncbi:hypothetical protein [uncultured Rhodospira sp.]|uniref:hypothetical protein n=1 Tax=uncultured Rhodospira sp. TaxID=1936189 RepID=UPI00260EE618|nr:hypothetical protein [uncultured Rhodospira sp.]